MCFTKSSVRLTHVQGIGVSQPGTDSGCPSQRVSLKKLQIGATAPAVARNKMALVALFKCTGVQIAALVSDRALRRTWPVHVPRARGFRSCPRKGGSVSAADSRLLLAQVKAPYSTYCPRGGGAAVVRLLSQLLRRRDCCRTTAGETAVR